MPTWKEKLADKMDHQLAEEIDVFETQMALRRQGKLDRAVALYRRAVALIEVQDAGMVNSGEPFGEDRIRIVRDKTEMAFGDGDRDF